MTFTADYPGAIVVEAAQYGYPKGAHNNKPRAVGLHTPEEPADDNPTIPTPGAAVRGELRLMWVG